MASNFQCGKLVTVAGEVEKESLVRKVIGERIATARKVSFHIIGSLAAIPIIVWLIRHLVIQPGRADAYDYLPFPIGGVLVLLGLMFSITGLAILADLIFNFSGRLQQKEGTDSYQDCIFKDLTRMKNEIAAREIKTTSEVIVRIIATVISLFMLLWTTYTGYKLATEHRRERKYDHLAFSVGVITMAFGLVYFILGLALIRELAQDLSAQLQQKEKGNWH